MPHISYQEFSDTLNSGKGIRFSGDKHVTYREIVVIALAIVFIVIAGGCCVALLASKGKGETTTVVVNVTEICTSHSCLYSSAKLAAFRDRQADPCDNFYNYACGNWMEFFPKSSIHPDRRDRTTFHALNEKAATDLSHALITPARSDAPAHEVKIKKFYASCIDDFKISKDGALHFINLLLKPAGGWQAVPTLTGWSAAGYSVKEAFKKVHVDFWTDALFSVRIEPDRVDKRKNAIEIGLGGLTLNWWDYVDSTAKHLRLFAATKTFMKTIAKLVIRDSGSAMTDVEMDTKADEFANDVFNFEATIGNVTWHTLPSDDPHDHQNRVSVSELNGLSDQFDWQYILTSMFQSAGVNRNTKVVLLEKGFLGKLNTVVKNLPNKQRTLNNYFTWKLMHGYVTDLGWEYVHANRVFWVARTGSALFTGIPKYCFNKIKYHFSDALGSIYIRDHLVKDEKNAIDEIVKYLKMGLMDRLDNINWMEQSSQNIAIQKVKRIVDKVGYPQWMTNDDYIDKRYASLDVTNNDYLNNLLEIAKFEREKTNQKLVKGEDRSEWRYPVWQASGGYDMWWNELIINAGLLQWPIYGKSFPKYYNFGSLGITFAHELIHSVDEIGGYYLPNGTYFDWWTKNTTIMYNKRRACLEDLDIYAGPYEPAPGSPKVSIKIDGAYVARELTAEMAAVRMAFYAYRDWTKDKAAEKTAPGLGLTNEQILFLSYAQTQCFVRRDQYSISRAERHIMPEDVRLNQALMHTPEFAEAFKCKQHSNMVAEKKCEVF